MLGKKSPLNTEFFLARNSDQPEVAPRQSQQVQFLLDKYMHAENLILAKSMELKKKEIEFSALEEKCRKLTEKICILEKECSQTHSKVIFEQKKNWGKIKSNLEIGKTQGLVIDEMSYQTKYRKWLQEKSELQQYIKDITTQNDKLKVIIEGCFMFMSGIVSQLQGKEYLYLKGLPPKDIDISKDSEFTPGQLSEMLNDCHLLMFSGSPLVCQESNTDELLSSAQVNTPLLSQNPSSIQVSKETSTTVQALQDTEISSLGQAPQFVSKFPQLVTPEELIGMCFMELQGTN